MILTNVPCFAIFSVAFSQLIATLGFAPATRASSLVPPSNEYAIEFHPPENRGAPDVAVGGATRCLPQFTPLVPHDFSKDYGDLSSPHFGLTVRPNPTFFVSLDSRKIQEIYFEIYEYDTEERGNDGDLVYETSREFNGLERRQQGAIGINLPPDVTLESGKLYRWYLDAVTGGDAVEVVSDSGWIERVEVSPDLGWQLITAKTPLDRAQVYAEAGIWHDAFDILARERRLDDTRELKEEWEELLTSAGFPEHLAKTPLLDRGGDRRSEPR
ncbi:DUF928 domain-containing protein [Zarconia navalis]|nr:DUF928 domain-containing protein [Zarconia navalis]